MASTVASSVAQLLAQHTDDDVLQALQLFDSLRPHLREHIAKFAEPLKRYEGQLGHLNPHKGFGFITSSEASQDFSKDVFVSTNETGKFQQGERVTFTVVANKNGQPQARLVEGADGSVPLHMESLVPAKLPPVDLAWEEPAAKRVRVAPPPLPPSRGVAPPPPAVYPVQQQQLPQQHFGQSSSRYVGAITSFNEQSHFGFITSHRATQEFGKDVFLSSMEIGDCRVGETVSFEIAINKNGKPQARNLQAAASAPASQPSRAPQPVARQADLQDAPEELARYVGSIQTFSPDKHFGFIACAEIFQQFSKDVFLSDQEIAGFQVGDMVSFRVVLNNRGNPQARDLGAPDALDELNVALRNGGAHESDGFLA